MLRRNFERAALGVQRERRAALRARGLLSRRPDDDAAGWSGYLPPAMQDWAIERS
jgi:hypothetical protein